MFAKYTNDKLWIVHCYSMSGLAQACIGIKLLCFKLFFSMSKFYSYMHVYVMQHFYK